MNHEHMVTWISFFSLNLAWERTWFAIHRIITRICWIYCLIGIIIFTSNNTPSANLTSPVATPVGIQAISLLKAPCRPFSLCITVCELLNPLYRTCCRSFLVGDLHIRDPPVAYIVTALNEQLTTTSEVLCVRIVLASLQYYGLPVCCNRNGTGGSRTGERSMKVLCNRTLDLKGDSVRRVIL